MRKFVFANGEIYHVYNRSIEQKPCFIDKKEYLRACLTVDFYQFANPPLRLSKAILLNLDRRETFFNDLRAGKQKIVELISYCFMPNHFHFLLKQMTNNGVSKFISNFSDSYTKYFNIKHKRAGPIFEGNFKAVRIETEEQLIHTSRYIHLNPVTSFIINESQLDSYPWSSFLEYLGADPRNLCNKVLILSSFPSQEKYREFVHDQIKFAQELNKIKHLIFEK